MSLGPAEILVILVVALLVLGPTKLPEAARQVGKAMAEFRRVTSGFQAEVRDAFQEPTPASPPTEFSVEPVHVPPPLPPADAVPPMFSPDPSPAPVPEAPEATPQAVAPDAPAPLAPSPDPSPAPGPQLPPDPPAH
jgi:Tat protein translocase TatB subunit